MSKHLKTRDLYGNLRNGLRERESIIIAMNVDTILRPKDKEYRGRRSVPYILAPCAPLDISRKYAIIYWH